MIICDQFIVINFPKTGSSFVREVMKNIHLQRVKKNFFYKVFFKFGLIKSSYRELLLPNIRNSSMEMLADQHGTVSQIPIEYSDRKIISVIRNPYERFLSLFEFRWWAKYPPIERSLIDRHFPKFPNLSIDDYVKLCELTAHFRLNGNNPLNIGIQTIQFIQFFFKKPEFILKNMSIDYLNSATLFKSDIADIIFLRQENLRYELSEFIINHGYTKKEAVTILNYPNVNKTKKIFDDRKKIWTPRAISYVEENEKLLFKISESYNIKFTKPIIDN